MMSSSSVASTILVLVMCCCAAIHGQRISAPVGKNYTQLFEGFKQDYKMKYPTAAEERKRFHIFSQNMKAYGKLNRLNPHAVFGVNEFADQTAEEFKVRHNAEKYYAKRREERRIFDAEFLASKKRSQQGVEIGHSWPTPAPVPAGANMTVKDWRRFGAVTKVKNQGSCLSCWAFSATGNIEGQWFLANHSLVSLSEQEFVSCGTKSFKLDGCQGLLGVLDDVFEWVGAANGGGVTGEADLPYVSGGGSVPKCPQLGNLPRRATIGGSYNVDPDEEIMGQWLWQNGPVSVSVDASSWMGYRGGVMTHCAKKTLDHGVLLVGFDDNHSPPYWIVKNSWGGKWGEDGYIRIEKGTNQCDVTATPCSSTVVSYGTPRPATPSPPPGWGPPPSSGPGSGIKIKSCDGGDGCVAGCTTTVEQPGSCFQLNGEGPSAQVSCGGGEVNLYLYNSFNCQGSQPVPQTYSTDQCIQSPLNRGNMVEFSC